ncbi:beta-lactamase-like protein [Aspergillus avenaceus]|uniref:Beta-lactamase-like protein n=1 Tax=Aspergillus avenaceus TaxID=36643 RepID=A0A5N6TVF0_ASPAV|nr:beta-lactamase-like protein [Aspergillus avenaceus]
MALGAAVYISPPTPFQSPGKGSGGGLWSPISCTLIYSATEAVLVDTPITIKQTQERIAPKRKLSYIYITHGHGDHFFGLPVLVQRFPEAKPVATAATVEHMKDQIEAKAFLTQWESRFPGQIAQPFVLAQPLPASGEFKLQDKYSFQPVEVHQMLFEANTAAKREEWIAAVEKIEALDPLYVVPVHCQEGEIMGRWHLANTKQYIRDFAKVLEGKPKSPREIVEAMTKLYPDRYNTGALIMGAMGYFQALKQSRI